MTRKQAAEQDLLTFFTNKKCKYGHPPERYTSNGGCVGCRHAAYRDDIEHKKQQTKEWRKSNPEKAKEAYQKWYHAEGKAKKIAYNKEYVAKNRERVAAVAKTWYVNNKSNVSQYMKERYKKSRDQLLAFAAEYRKKNPDKMKRYREDNPHVVKAYDQNRRARKKQAAGKFTAKDINRIADLQKHKCAICRDRLKRGKGGHHVDHIMPLARGGNNWPSNLQLLCPPCNLAKHARDPIEHMQSLGFLL